MELKPGAKLGPYELVSAVGKGGMGEVWRAHDPQIGRDVAIKVSAQQFTDRFEREVRAIGALNHPNICTLYHVGPNYLVMELIEGPTLADRIAQGAIPLEEALGIAKQIADALEAAHEKNIVHRDLKPANIKIRPDGSVKVLDFGLAKAGRNAGSDTRFADHDAGHADGNDPRHGGLHEPRAGARTRRSTSAPTSGPSASCSMRC